MKLSCLFSLLSSRPATQETPALDSGKRIDAHPGEGDVQDMLFQIQELASLFKQEEMGDRDF